MSNWWIGSIIMREASSPMQFAPAPYACIPASFALLAIVKFPSAQDLQKPGVTYLPPFGILGWSLPIRLHKPQLLETKLCSRPIT